MQQRIVEARKRFDCETIAHAALGEPTKRVGADLLWSCPNHEDRHPSLAINPAKDVFLCAPCNASGTAWQFAAFLARLDAADKPGVTAWLKERGVFSSKQHSKPPKNTRGAVVAEYIYRDAGGSSVARKLRFEPGQDGRKKDFSWQRWENGAWTDGLSGLKLPLYRLVEIQNEPCVVLTEGEKDADVGAQHGLPTATSGGVGSFREDHADALRGKDCLIIPDADDAGRAYAQNIAAMLRGKAASVKVCEIPHAKDLAEALENGMTVGEIFDLFEKSPEWTPPAIPDGAEAKFAARNGEELPYAVESGRVVFRKKTAEATILVPLCNFTAKIVEDILVDDGLETRREFVIDGVLASGKPLPKIRVPSNQFAAMNWPLDRWGRCATVSAGMNAKDRLREALQLLSPESAERTIYAHTGWREIGGGFFFLHAGGAVGRGSVETDLSAELSRYALPAVPESPREAMLASLTFLDLAPLIVTAPLWAAMYRAPLASFRPLDVSLFCFGPTGTMKSTLAALALAHYGDFSRDHVPSNWESTANSLERRAFTLKDLPLLIDDFAPNALNAREMQAKAERIFRAQGNLSGRGRLTSDIRERPSHPPRGMIVATGESLPAGMSILARLLLVEFSHGAIDLGKLSALQNRQALLPHAMAAYLEWLRPQLGRMREILDEGFREVRAKFLGGPSHLRIPETLANLWLGAYLGLQFAQSVGAITPDRAESLGADIWRALDELGASQSSVVEDAKPSHRFFEVLATLLTQRRAAIVPKSQAVPNVMQGMSFVGWYDHENLYLVPDAAFQAVVHFCVESSDPFPVKRGRLFQDLWREGFSAGGDNRHHTVPERFGPGVRQRVLKINIAAIKDKTGLELSLGGNVIDTAFFEDMGASRES
jgi:hypothetical protein